MGGSADYPNPRISHPPHRRWQHLGDFKCFYVQTVTNSAELFHSVIGSGRFNCSHFSAATECGLFSGRTMDFRYTFVQNVAHFGRDVLHSFNFESLRYSFGSVLGHYRPDQLCSEKDSEKSAQNDSRSVGVILAHLLPSFNWLERLA